MTLTWTDADDAWVERRGEQLDLYREARLGAARLRYHARLDHLAVCTVTPWWESPRECRCQEDG